MSAPPKAQLDALGVLRRAPEDSDHGPAVTGALRFLGPATTGIRTAFIRRVGATANGGTVVLIPAKRWEPASRSSVNDAICLVVTDPATHGAAKACWGTDAFKKGQATASLGKDIYGLVPDGVTEVVATFKTAAGRLQSPLLGGDPSGGPPINSTVKDNFFAIRAPGNGDDPEPGVASRPIRIEGLDTSGDVVLTLTP